MKDWFSKPDNRKTVYNVITALIPILVLTGVMVPGLSDLVLVLAAAVLGVGGTAMASVNTGAKHPEQSELDPEQDISEDEIDPELLGA